MVELALQPYCRVDSRRRPVPAILQVRALLGGVDIPKREVPIRGVEREEQLAAGIAQDLEEVRSSKDRGLSKLEWSTVIRNARAGAREPAGGGGLAGDV